LPALVGLSIERPWEDESDAKGGANEGTLKVLG